MNTPVKEFFGQIKIGAKQTHRNMTLYCLLSAQEASLDFLSLDEALEKQVLIVTEVNEGGSVPELKVINRSDQKVLLLDGEELVGAKQNRVLNVTMLIAPHSETVIPVSCVEQGRWSYRSREFGSARRSMSADLKKKKIRSVGESLRTAGLFASAQTMVWQEINAKFDRMAQAPSPTRAMSDLYDAHRDTIEDYLNAFRPVDNQIGMVVFIDGEIAGLEILDKYHAYKQIHGKLVQSYVIDALDTIKPGVKTRALSSKAKALKVLESGKSAAVEVRKSVALGEDIRLESREVVGAGLAFEGQVLQMSIFLKNDSEPQGRKGSLKSASRRRNSLFG
ncbi:MAG: hypothetical protein LDL33_13555 [Desulfomonile sp.]|nr:hypothetical protein [Desulfomonile sp.]